MEIAASVRSWLDASRPGAGRFGPQGVRASRQRSTRDGTDLSEVRTRGDDHGRRVGVHRSAAACAPSSVAGSWGGGLFERLRNVDPLDDGADVRRGLADRLDRGPWIALVARAR